MTENLELKQYAQRNGVSLWKIAERWGVADATFSRKLRKPFSPEDSERFKMYVDQIAKGE